MTDTFKHHEYDAAQQAASDSIRDAAGDLEAVIALRCAPSREKSLAMTKLEECAMRANKALALHGTWEGGRHGE